MSKMNKKKYEDDDGHTVIDMNVEGMHGYKTPKQRKNIEEMRQLKINKKERRAIFWGSFLATIPGVIITALCLLGAFFLVYLWLK